MEQTVTLREQLSAGLVAGIVGGVVLALFLLATAVAAGAPPGVAFAQNYAWSASVLFGPSMLSNPAAPAIGLLIHFCVSIAWAVGYVYLVRSTPQLLTRPWISGAGFGLVVYVCMQVVLIAAGQFHRPKPGQLGIAIIAHCVFFGIPIALVVSRTLRQARGRLG